jgi:Glycosyltransferase Family 4
VSPSRRRRRASPAWEGRRRIIVATFPGRGLYARHLGHPEGVDAVHRPTVKPANHPEPPVLSRHWLRHHLDEVDVVHLHGLQARFSAEEVAATADAVRAAGTPLVVTGYHLSDPAGRPGHAYDRQLDELVPRADAVVTLTEPAAQEMRRRWGADPIVLPHPHAVDFVRMRQERRPRRGELLVGMHLAGLNLPTDPLRLTTALSRAVSALQRRRHGARLVVHLHETVLDPGAAGYNPCLVRELDEAVRSCGGLLRVHRPFTESQLWDHLFSLDVSVVPGLHGSHSIWPEACADLGTQAVLPAGTHAAAQRPCLVYSAAARDRTGRLDVEVTADSLLTALTTASEQEGVWRADPEERWAERVKVAESLRALYERLLGDA